MKQLVHHTATGLNALYLASNSQLQSCVCPGSEKHAWLLPDQKNRLETPSAEYKPGISLAGQGLLLHVCLTK